MKSYKLIHQLITLLEEFEQENNQEISLSSFTGFLINHVAATGQTKSMPDVRFGTNAEHAQQRSYQLDNAIGRLFVYMSRYAKNYIKKALEGTPLQTAEDFTYLAILNTHDDLLKGDLISRNLQEKTSGTEVIRRLLAAGLIKQRDDEDDKRGKRISITDKGKDLLYRVFEDMNDVGKMVAGNLSLSEKLTLQFLLQKLDSFHYRVHEDKTLLTKDDLRALASQISA